EFGKPTGNRVLIAANRLRCGATGQINLAVVQAVVPQLAAQCNPERPRNEIHRAPRRCIQDCQRYSHERPFNLSFAFLHGISFGEMNWRQSQSARSSTASSGHEHGSSLRCPSNSCSISLTASCWKAWRVITARPSSRHQGPRAQAADLDRHATAANRRMPFATAPHLDVEDVSRTYDSARVRPLDLIDVFRGVRGQISL